MKRIQNLVAVAFAVIFASTTCVLPAFSASKKTAKKEIPQTEGNLLVQKMRIGWNLGNTLDAWKDGQNNGLESETCWEMPLTKPEMFTGLVKGGIKTVRIPITWHNHLIDDKYTIDPAWMARVKEVVGWALDAGLYVIINDHHDTAKNENLSYGQGYYPTEKAKAESLRFLTRVWEQISSEFNNAYDDKLIFEIINEPRLVGHEREWWYDANHPDCAKAQKIIVEYEEACIAKIRASGGKNANRFIMVPGYIAQPWAAMADSFRLPNDSAKDRLIVSVHMYDPWVFAGEAPGERKFTQKHKELLKGTFDALNKNFVNKGVPVVIGECGATNKNNLKDREAWFKFYFENAKANGITAILWDNGVVEVGKDKNYSEHFGFYDRLTQQWYFPTLLKAAFEGIEAAEK